MDLQLRKIAAHHAKCYRSYKAYLSGFEDAQPSELFETEGHRIKAGWVTAVEMVQKRLLAADPERQWYSAACSSWKAGVAAGETK